MANITSENETLYIVVIEWDGERPPTSWYNRLHALAGRVRGDKSETPLARRDDGRGVVMQEGAILCPSESLARTLAFIARDEYGAAAVAIGEASMTTAFTMSREDSAVISRIQKTLGKRGRKPKAEKWAVTCLEEMRTYDVEHSRPYQCPHCSGMKIKIRRGDAQTFREPGGDIFTAWARTRFSGPHWEPATVADSGADAPEFDDLLIGNADDVAFLAELQDAAIVDQIAELPRAEQYSILDAVFVARRHTSGEKRTNARVRAIAAYFQNGGTRTDFQMAETPTPDVLDVAAPLSPEYAARLWLNVMNADAAE